MRRIALALTALSVLALSAASGMAQGQVTPTPSPSSEGGSSSDGGVRIAAVGDMVCSAHPNERAQPDSSDRRYRRGFCQYGKVSDLIVDGDYDRFLPLGDLQYYRGTLDHFRRFYDPAYGRVMHITAPAPGNHESYSVDDRGKPYEGYRAYFGPRAHWNRAGGSYSYNLGGWHMISLNSEWCSDFNWTVEDGKWGKVKPWPHGSPWGCRAGDRLRTWLERDLEANADAQCTLAYFHHPAYFWVNWGSGPKMLTHDGYTKSRPLYRVLYRHGADVVLNGHQHFYQRLKPIDPTGALDPTYGFAEFIVGTGGDTLGALLPEDQALEQVAASDNTAFGVLEMTLRDGAYDFEFVPAAGNPGHWRSSSRLGYDIFENGGGEMPVDEGSGTCHDAPPEPADGG